MTDFVEMITIKHELKTKSTEFKLTDAYEKLDHIDRLEILNNVLSFLQSNMSEEILHTLKNARRRKTRRKP
jgi:DNA-binding MltR family transcriptional regulator